MRNFQSYGLSWLLACAVLVGGSVVQAQRPDLSPSASHRAAALELIRIIDAQRMGRTMLARLDHRLVTAALQKMAEDRQFYRAEMRKFSQQLMHKYAQQMGWQRIRTELVDHYTKHYSETEIRRTLRYIKVSGTKYLMRNPKMLKPTSAFLHKRFRKLRPELIALGEQLIADIDLRNTALRSAPSTATPAPTPTTDAEDPL